MDSMMSSSFLRWLQVFSRSPAQLLLYCFGTLLPGCGAPDIPSGTLQSVLYQPSLGGGVNYEETKTFRTCVNRTDVATSPLALSRLYKETRISSRRQLNETLNVSASISAKALWGEAGGSFSYFSDVKINEDAFYWLIDANYAVTSDVIPTNGDFDLTPQAKSILQHEGLHAFYQACGSHFYSGRQFGGRYTLLYEFSSKQDEVVKRLSTQVQYGGFGLSAKASFAKFIHLAQQASVLKVYSHIQGGGHQIANYVNDPEKLAGELAKLQEDLVNRRQGVVLKWFMSSYDMFEEVLRKKREEGITTPDDAQRDQALALYFQQYADNESHIAHRRQLLVASNQEEPLFIYRKENLTEIQEQIRSYARQNDQIKQLAQGCLKGLSSCKTSDIVPLALQVPAADKDLRSLGSWEIYPYIYAKEDAVSYIKLMGYPHNNYAERLFGQKDYLLFMENQQVFLMGKNPWNSTGQLQIGSSEMIIDPLTGKKRLNICMGNFSSLCNLRVVESPQTQGEDGYPMSKILLSIFTPEGFIARKHFLFPSG
jgi:hypothetical protein